MDISISLAIRDQLHYTPLSIFLWNNYREITLTLTPLVLELVVNS